jgi:hypothetical protein
MKNIIAILSHLVPLAFIAAAVYLAVLDIDGWGWCMLAGFLSHHENTF